MKRKKSMRSPKQKKPEVRLLPCPFCGYDAKIDSRNTITCTNCAAGMYWDVMDIRPIVMIQAWNRRDYG